ncbi:hypothetical protein H5J25_07315 [Sphingomonas aliaeris]|uniref:Uncharacterized protein n=1 Tax=Sphingomonas aliaeris TaxID=2759526 RepID=A0A974NX71_9SPHN|nr:hypothetical protein [Sphingomonas aliaeris]QQV78442.1 hypothetical protein H5J25_07315 [Sphingomonas aliaeris]
MPATLAFSLYGLLAMTAVISPGQSYRIAETFASAPRTCAILQAAYTKAIGGTATAYPNDVRSSSRRLELVKIVPEYRVKMGLSKKEYDDLIVQEASYGSADFRPSCSWKGIAGPAQDAEGHATFVSFTTPIFSTNGRLAVVETSFLERKDFGHGLVCIVRLKDKNWTARCLPGWIS